MDRCVSLMCMGARERRIMGACNCVSTMPAVMGSTGVCDCAQVVVVWAIVCDRWMAVTQVTTPGELVVLADV